MDKVNARQKRGTGSPSAQPNKTGEGLIVGDSLIPAAPEGALSRLAAGQGSRGAVGDTSRDQ